ncbi:hypothetical protein LIER_40473 [Lithospermum erythrorhizon]|uniref:Uncharacterized protein n=1 Tax=Lithospermum erythrorhizon TaxID=34254 RepID=A0AAV3QXR5_LITER
MTDGDPPPTGEEVKDPQPTQKANVPQNPSFMQDPPKPTYAMVAAPKQLYSSSKEYYNHATINDAFTPTPPTTFQGKPAVVFKHADKEKFLKKMRHV